MTIQRDSGVLQHTADVQRVQSNHNKGITTMNKPTVASLKAAYKNNDFTPFVGAHHTTIKAAIKHERDREALVAAMIVRKMDVPEWLMTYYKERNAEVVVAAEPKAPTKSTNALIVESVDTQAANMFKPLLLGGSVVEWTRELAQTEVAKRDGEGTYNALFGATFQVNRAISDINRRVYGAYLAGIYSESELADLVTKIQDRLATAAGAVAAVQGRNTPTAAAEIMEVAVKTRDHGVDGRGEDRLAELNEQITELRDAIASGDFKASDVQLAHELIAEQQQLITLKLMKQGESDAKEWSDSDSAKPNDTGMIRAAIESLDHLLSLDPRDVYGAEEEATKALWAAKQLAFPLTPELDERLAQKWENAIDYAAKGDKEATYGKCVKRALLLRDGVDATIQATTKDGREWNKPLAAQMRWAVNHVTRSVWRDIKRLEITREDYEERLGKLEKAAQEEELGYKQPNLTRIPMGESQELGYEIELPFIKTIGNEDLPQGETQHIRMRTLFNKVMSEIDEVLPTLRALYAEWRQLDMAHAPIWSTFANESLPLEQPPIYWNMRGWYMDEESATEALLSELAENVQRRLIETADQAAAAISELLEDNFNI